MRLRAVCDRVERREGARGGRAAAAAAQLGVASRGSPARRRRRAAAAGCRGRATARSTRMRSMPSRRLRVARRFWSSSRALSWARRPGGTVPPGLDAERVQRVLALLGVALLGDRLRVVAGDLEELGGGEDRAGDARGCRARAPASSARRSRASSLVARRCAMPMWHCASRAARVGELGQADAVAAHEQVGDLVDARHPQPHGAHARADGRDAGRPRSARTGSRRCARGGSSSSFSSTFEVRSVMRSASSMIMTR